MYFWPKLKNRFPQKLKQIGKVSYFSIHAWHLGYLLPCVMALMQGKSEKLYRILFDKIKEKARERDSLCDLNLIKDDDKRAVELLDYFTETWIEGNFEISEWNNPTTTQDRTNNKVEGFLSKLNRQLN